MLHPHLPRNTDGMLSLRSISLVLTIYSIRHLHIIHNTNDIFCLATSRFTFNTIPIKYNSQYSIVNNKHAPSQHYFSSKPNHRFFLPSSSSIYLYTHLPKTIVKLFFCSVFDHFCIFSVLRNTDFLDHLVAYSFLLKNFHSAHQSLYKPISIFLIINYFSVCKAICNTGSYYYYVATGPSLPTIISFCPPTQNLQQHHCL